MLCGFSVDPLSSGWYFFLGIPCGSVGGIVQTWIFSLIQLSDLKVIHSKAGAFSCLLDMDPNGNDVLSLFPFLGLLMPFSPVLLRMPEFGLLYTVSVSIVLLDSGEGWLPFLTRIPRKKTEMLFGNFSISFYTHQVSPPIEYWINDVAFFCVPLIIECMLPSANSSVAFSFGVQETAIILITVLIHQSNACHDKFTTMPTKW